MDSGRLSARAYTRTSGHSSLAMSSPFVQEGWKPLQVAASSTPSTRPPLAIQQHPILRHDVCTDESTSQGNTSRHDTPHQEDAEAILLQQISFLRSSHDTYIKSLKLAHDQEVASHLAYIAFLEQRQACRTEQITTGTTLSSPEPCELPGLDVSTTTMQSSVTSLESQSQASHDAEVVLLRRQISTMRKEQTENADLLHLGDQMRSSMDQRDRRIIQLKDLYKRAKGNERGLRNAVSNLEARLEDANNQRVDILEGFQTACNTIEALKKQKTLEPRGLSSHGASHLSARHHRSRSTQDLNGCNPAALTAQIRDLQDMLKQKDDHIACLEKERQNRNSTEKHNEQRFIELQNHLDDSHRAVTQAEHDRDRYHSLLQAEVRRQARFAAKRSSVSPSVAREAAGDVQHMLHGIKGTVAEDDVPAFLENQLQHCLGEIILYKMDVRGYREDLKETRAQLESLHATLARQLPTPPRSASRSRESTISDQNGSRQGGLGIVMSQAPVTPPRSIDAATTPTLLTVVDTLSAVSTPLHRPHTPQVPNKQLPKPPSTTLSPQCCAEMSPPRPKVLRTETFQSVLSYAATPELLKAGVFNYASQGQSGESNAVTPPKKGEPKLISIS